MEWVVLLVALVLGYFAGSIPFGFLVAKAKGVDIRRHGSGNIGATNVLRVIGRPYGIFVFVCDFLKGLVVVVLAAWLVPAVAGGAAVVSAAKIVAGLGAILGHNYTCWLGFKGGKGIATSAGVLLGIMPLALVVAVAVWVVVFYTTRYVALASVLAAAVLPLTLAVQGRWSGAAADRTLLAFAVLIAVLAIWRHRSNIGRLIAGTEPKMTGGKPIGNQGGLDE